MLHVASDVSAVPVEYLPRRHSEHAADPFTSLYVPLGHALQFCPSGPVYPALQVQMGLPPKEFACIGQFVHVDTDVSPVSALYFPAKHSRHALEPFTSLYFPLKQAMQSLPSAPV